MADGSLHAAHRQHRAVPVHRRDLSCRPARRHLFGREIPQLDPLFRPERRHVGLILARARNITERAAFLGHPTELANVFVRRHVLVVNTVSASEQDDVLLRQAEGDHARVLRGRGDVDGDLAVAQIVFGGYLRVGRLAGRGRTEGFTRDAPHHVQIWIVDDAQFRPRDTWVRRTRHQAATE